ncbi:MAG: aminotransferase class III-fold pyridoxal phosphate-dependent enzyme [Planctomycetes bacterium]|nr:aminotransferase class III-fold pyridoxal phosphate-dependent enzyme [Planctomycetota bacterium]
MTDTAAIRAIEDEYLLPTYRKFPLALVEGCGSFVTDAAGRRYLDLYGGHAVAITGHCHPKVVAAIREQAGKLLFYSNLVYLEVRARAARALASFAPEGMRSFLCNSGTEANETALKIARRHTGRPGIVAMERSFHGRTLGALSATELPPYREQAGPLVPGTTFVPFGDLAAAGAALGDDTAAVILEPIQSMGGVREAEAGYYRGLRDLCSARGALLVFDEVQTAPARTGAAFYGRHHDVLPDLITTAKGIASGLPCGLVLVAAHVASRVRHGEQGTTFGGGPLACAALAATLEVIVEEDLAGNARRTGDHLRDRLLATPGVREVRGRGLLLGAVLDRKATMIRDTLLDRGIIVSTTEADPSVLRLLPPLTLTPEEADLFVDALRDVLKEGPARER